MNTNLFCRVTRFLWLSVLLLLPFNTFADVNWLIANQNPDGSISQSTDIAPAFMSTAETLQAIHLTASNVDTTAAVNFLNADTSTSTARISKKIIVNTQQGIDTTGLIAALVSAQNSDSGWGELPGYNSTVIDTAYAIQALATANYQDSNVISTALAYLYTQQHTDGGFAHTSVNQSAIYITAQAIIALQQYQQSYNVASYITAAVNYLLANESANGGWNTEWETAAALMAIIPTTADSSIYVNAVTALQAAQLADGSWSSDVYITALATQALFVASNVALPTLPTKGTFTGKVVDAATLQAIQGATVTMTDGAITQTATTGNDGRFAIANVEPGSYQFTYTATSMSVVTQTASVVAGQTLDLGTAQLSATPTLATVQGVVVDSSNGQPLAGAVISVIGASTVTTTTNTSGQYAVQVAPGSINLDASLAGYIDATGSASVVAGQLVNFSPALSQTAPTDTTVTLSGSVIDAKTSSAIAGATISVSGSSTAQVTTDATGQFTLAGLTAGSLTLNIAAAGYYGSGLSLVATEGANASVGTIQLTPIPTKGTVKGTVIDSATNAPLAGVAIQISGSTTVNATTDATGQFSAEVEAGSITLTASLSNYQPITTTATLSVGQTLNFQLGLSTEPPANNPTTLTGRVLDFHTRAPISSALATINDTGVQASTDGAGVFTFNEVATGVYTLNVSATNYQSHVFVISVPDSGGTLTVGDVVLTSLTPPNASVVQGTITDSVTGSAISNAVVTQVGTTNTAVTDSQGQYTLANIGDLSFSIQLSATGYISQTIPVSLTEPTTSTVNAVLQPAAAGGLIIDSFTTDKATYGSHETVGLNLQLSTTSTGRVRPLIELVDSNNQTVQLLSTSVSETGGDDNYTIIPGYPVTLNSSWYTSSYTPGNYMAHLKVLDASSGAVMAERQLNIIVVPTEVVDALSLKVTPKFASVGETVQVTLVAPYLNKSNVDTTLALQYSFKDTAGTVVQTGQVTHTLTASDTQGEIPVATFPYTFPGSGDYTSELTITSGAVTNTDLTRISSVAPSVRIEATDSITPTTVVPDGDKRIKVRIQLKGVEAQ